MPKLKEVSPPLDLSKLSSTLPESEKTKSKLVSNLHSKEFLVESINKAISALNFFVNGGSNHSLQRRYNLATGIPLFVLSALTGASAYYKYLSNQEIDAGSDYSYSESMHVMDHYVSATIFLTLSTTATTLSLFTAIGSWLGFYNTNEILWEPVITACKLLEINLSEEMEIQELLSQLQAHQKILLEQISDLKKEIQSLSSQQTSQGYACFSFWSNKTSDSPTITSEQTSLLHAQRRLDV